MHDLRVREERLTGSLECRRLPPPTTPSPLRPHNECPVSSAKRHRVMEDVTVGAFLSGL
jgi:hypothetical protein